MTQRRFGWLPDDKDVRDISFAGGRYLGTTTAPPHAASLSEHVSEVLDQGQIQSCVANSVAQAVRVCHSDAGIPHPELTSRLFLYWNARHYADVADVDQGSRIRDAIRSLSKLGYCREAYWPYAEAKWAERPSWRAYQAASDQRIHVAYYRIDSSGDAKVNDVKLAISSGHPVVFGSPVTQAFVEGDTSELDSPSFDHVVGNHAMLLTEYNGDWFGGPNSWGQGWANENGWFAMSANHLKWEAVIDIWAITAAPAYSGAA